MCGERSTATNQPQSCLYIANTSEHSHMLYTERTAGHTMANQRSHWHWIIVATRSETIRDHQRRATTIDDRHRSVTWSLPSLHYHRLRRRQRGCSAGAQHACRRAQAVRKSELPRSPGEAPVKTFKRRFAGSVTITTESRTDGATTCHMSRMNLSGYVAHVTVFSWMFTTACCFVVGLGLGLGLGLDLVSGW